MLIDLQTDSQMHIFIDTTPTCGKQIRPQQYASLQCALPPLHQLVQEMMNHMFPLLPCQQKLTPGANKKMKINFNNKNQHKNNQVKT